MLKKIKQNVYEANMMLPKCGLVRFTWGNASEVDAKRRYMVIKPSGVSYESLTADMMCVVSLEDGSVAEGALKPSTDSLTHIELYKRFPGIGGVVHTHSDYATAFAQAGLGIPCFGTTHADYFYGEIPCTRTLKPCEINESYELYTGGVIAETFERHSIDPLAVPGALVYGHGPFAWGKSAADAVANAAYLETVARLAHLTKQIATGGATPVSQDLLDKHYKRKHGKDAYYGQ